VCACGCPRAWARRAGRRGERVESVEEEKEEGEKEEEEESEKIKVCDMYENHNILLYFQTHTQNIFISFKPFP
jgi:hypothetical protein